MLKVLIFIILTILKVLLSNAAPICMLNLTLMQRVSLWYFEVA